MSDRVRFVVVEDDPPIRRFLRAGTGDEAEWFEAGTGTEGVKLVAQESPDVVLLDLGLPDIDGLEVLRRIREWSEVPVIVLSARGRERDKIAALDGGADDYLTKPFTIGELMARVRVVMRRKRSASGDEPVFETKGLRIDFAARIVTLDGREVHLTVTEYRMLSLLARHAGRVVTQKQMLTEVWGPEYEDSTHTLRVHMGNLRQKIEADPARPTFVRTETGVGYRMIVE